MMRIKGRDPESAKIKEDRIFISLLTLALFLFLELFLAPLTAPALAMSVPAGTNYFYYNPVVLPTAVTDPSLAQPIGLGPVSAGGGTVSFRVGMEAFDGPVDIYVAYMMASDPDHINIMNADGSFQYISMDQVAQAMATGFGAAGIFPWRANITGPVDELPFEDIPVSLLPPDSYSAFLLVAPAGDYKNYFLWETDIKLLALAVNKFGAGAATSDDGGINCGDACVGTYAPGATVNLNAVGNNFLKWGGCDASEGNACSVIINNDRTVTPMFGTRPELKPNVKVINDNITQCLTVTNNADGSATYSFTLANCPGQATELSKLSPGDVLDITAGATVIRRVTSVDSSTPGYIVAETVQGGLADLADQGTIVFSGALVPSGSLGVAAAQTNNQSRMAAADGCDYKCDGTNLRVCSGDKDDKCPNGDDMGVTYSPNCTFTCTAGIASATLKISDTSTLGSKITVGATWARQLEADIPLIGHVEVDDPNSLADLIFKMQIDQTNIATVGLDGKLTYKKEYNVAGPYVLADIQAGPVNIAGYFSLVAGFDANAEVAAKTGMTSILSFPFGFKCEAPDPNNINTGDTLGNCKPTNDPPVKKLIFNEVKICGTATLKGYIKPEFQLALYGAIGTPIDIYPYAEVLASTADNGKAFNWEVDAGIDLSMGIDLFGLSIWDTSFPIGGPWCFFGDCLPDFKPLLLGPQAKIVTPASPFHTNLGKMPVSFKGSATDTNCSAIVGSCSWDFGDGSTWPPVKVDANGECKTTHTYYNDGGYHAYTVKLSVTDSRGETATDSVIIDMDSTPPSQPENVQVPLTTAKVTWDKPSTVLPTTCNCTSKYSGSCGAGLCYMRSYLDYDYKVTRKAYNGSGTLLSTKDVQVDGQGTSSSVTYLDKFGYAESKICYQVSSVDKYGNVSAPTDDKCAIANLIKQANPPAIAGTKVPGATSIPVSWDEIDGTNVSYTILRNDIPVKTLISPPFYDTGLLPHTTYCYKISVTENGVLVGTSDQTCLTTSADVTPPTTPTGLTATFDQTSYDINLSWNPSSDNIGVVGYGVYIGIDGAPIRYLYTAIATNASFLVDSGFSGTHTFCFKVSAFDAAGNESAKSAQACVTPQPGADTQAPTMPSGLTATAASSSQINLSWVASTDNVGVMGYKIYRDGSSTPLKTISGTGTIDSGLTASTQYCYKVSAFDAAGNESAKSTQACATTSNGAVQCTYTISPSSQSFDHTGGSGTISVSTSGSNCAWTATSNASFITITAGSSGTGNGTVSYTVSSGTALATGTITAAGQTFTVTRSGQIIVCAPLSIVTSPSSLSFTIAPGQSSAQSATVKDNCGNDLSYTISSVTYFPIGTEFTGWVSVPSAGAGSLAVTVTDPSLGPGTRSAGVNISSAGLPTLQLPVSLTVTCTPTSIVTIPSSISGTVSAGQSITLSVQVQNNCGTSISFTAHSTLYPSATASGTGTLSITLPALPKGTYHDTIVISSGGLPNYSLPATLTVN